MLIHYSSVQHIICEGFCSLSVLCIVIIYLFIFLGCFSSHELILLGTVGKPPQVNHNDLFIMFATLQFNQQTRRARTRMPHRRCWNYFYYFRYDPFTEVLLITIVETWPKLLSNITVPLCIICIIKQVPILQHFVT